MQRLLSKTELERDHSGYIRILRVVAFGLSRCAIYAIVGGIAAIITLPSAADQIGAQRGIRGLCSYLAGLRAASAYLFFTDNFSMAYVEPSKQQSHVWPHFIRFPALWSGQGRLAAVLELPAFDLCFPPPSLLTAASIPN